jgi:hypothetical protein
MTIDERTRHQLYLRLEEVLGNEQATTLMEHLPPVGWADVARQSDIAYLRQDIESLRRDLGAGLESSSHDLSAGLESGRHDLSVGLDAVRRDLSAGLESVRHDLTAREERFELRLEREVAGLRGEMATLRGDLQRELRLQGLAILGGTAAIVSVATAIGQLLS